MHQLPVPKSPALPIPPKEYDTLQQDQVHNALRLYFNRLDTLNSTLLGTTGGSYLNFPHAAVSLTGTATAAAINTAYQIDLSTADQLNGITLDAAGGLKTTFDGVYNYQFSLQLTNSDTQIHDVAVWLRRQNGSIADVPLTASYASVPNRHGGVDGAIVLAANFYVSLPADDIVSLWWSTTSTQVTLSTIAAKTTPYVAPASPAAVVTLSFVSTLPI